MNYRKITSFLGTMLLIIGASMLIPIGWSLYYGDNDWKALLLSSVITLACGFAAYRMNNRDGDFRNREALVVVTFSWLLASSFGALPYLFSGTFTSFADAFFETMSGFTTTGASVLTDIEALPHGILFWRSLTHWLGGMGIVVLLVAILSTIGNNGLQMLRAESPGPVTEKLKPRISETAKILWYTYVIMTVVEAFLLRLFGMSLFDALCHTFGTLATGGFSTKNASIGFYNGNPVIVWIIISFMFMAGVNFSLYYQALRGKSLRTFWRNSEFKLYAVLILGATTIVTLNLLLSTGYVNVGKAVTDASFQVVSVMTTTGYATADFDKWTFFSQSILILLMFIGGCSGSTGGSIKVGRILIIIKQCLLELKKVLHPRAIFKLRVDGKTVSSDIALNIIVFFFIFIIVTGAGTVFMSFLGLDLITAFTSVVATLCNVGPGLAKVGPVMNYGFIPDIGKYFLSFLMMLGRLELYTVLILFMPSFWHKSG